MILLLTDNNMIKIDQFTIESKSITSNHIKILKQKKYRAKMKLSVYRFYSNRDY